MMGKVVDWLLECFGDEIRGIHELKSWPDEFAALVGGHKRHEVRRCDRDFLVGDWLLLREWGLAMEVYSGRQLLREITHITPVGGFGLPGGLCVLSVR